METIITEEVYLAAKQALKGLGKAGCISRKLQAVIASYKHGIAQTSKVLGASRGSIYLWGKAVKEGRIDSLKNGSKHQDGLKLKAPHRDEIKVWLESDPNMTIHEVRNRLHKRLGVIVSKSTVHRAIQKLGFSHITGRPKHYKQDEASVEAFKK